MNVKDYVLKVVYECDGQTRWLIDDNDDILSFKQKEAPKGAPSFWLNYSMISVMEPEPTVRPPSRIAKRRVFSIATG